MPEAFDKEEDPEVARDKTLGWAALVFGGLWLVGAVGGGIIAVATAGMTDVQQIGGGYTAIVVGLCVPATLVIAWGALMGHARIKARQRRNHETVMHELAEIKLAIGLAVGDEVAAHRRQDG